eukprot:UN03072
MTNHLHFFGLLSLITDITSILINIILCLYWMKYAWKCVYQILACLFWISYLILRIIGLPALCITFILHAIPIPHRIPSSVVYIFFSWLLITIMFKYFLVYKDK